MFSSSLCLQRIRVNTSPVQLRVQLSRLHLEQMCSGPNIHVWMKRASSAPPDYRGHTTKMDQPTHATANIFPRKDQALVIVAKDWTKIKDYVNELTKFTGSHNIRFVSENLKKEFVYWWLTKMRVRILHQLIKLSVRPLTNKHRRIFISISNACPIIPHSEIENGFLIEWKD